LSSLDDIGEEEIEVTVKWGEELGTFDKKDSNVLKRER